MKIAITADAIGARVATYRDRATRPRMPKQSSSVAPPFFARLYFSG
jgi:hypothetical protein